MRWKLHLHSYQTATKWNSGLQYRSKVSYHLASRFLRDAIRVARYAIPVTRDAIRVARE